MTKNVVDTAEEILFAAVVIYAVLGLTRLSINTVKLIANHK